MIEKFLLWILFLGVLWKAKAQEMLFFNQIETLSNEWITDIAQDEKGFIWIGTEDGINRYDGYKLQLIRHVIEDKNSMAANAIHEIAMIKDTAYWIGTQGGGISVFYPKERRFENHRKHPKGIFSFVYKIIQVASDTLAIVTDEGVFLYTMSTGETHQIEEGSTTSKIATSNGVLWISTNNVLYGYDVRKNTIVTKQVFEQNIRMISVLQKKVLLSFTDHILLLDKTKEEKKIPVTDAIRYMTKNGDIVFLASEKKIYTFDPDQENIRMINTALPLHQADITSLFLDQQQLLWVGTSKGLYKEKNKVAIFKNPSISLHARRIIKYKGAIYIAGETGLYKIDKNKEMQKLLAGDMLALHASEEQLFVTNRKGTLFTIRDDQIEKEQQIQRSDFKRFSAYGIAQDAQHRIWVGSWASGIFVFDASGNFLQEIKLDTNSDKGESKILQMYLDHKDRLWITTAAYGLYMLANASSTDLTTPVPFQQYTSTRSDTTSLTSNVLFSVAEDQKGTIWIGSDMGIVAYQEKNNAFLRLKKDAKLFDKKVMALEADTLNNLWITTINSGVYVYNLISKEWMHYTTKDGLISDAFLFTSMYYDQKEERLLAGTNNGIQTITVDTEVKVPDFPPVIVTAVRVHGEPSDYLADFKTPFDQDIQLSYLQNDFSVRFSNLDYKHIPNIRYAYSMDGGKWKETDVETAYFSNIAYGVHELKVKPVYNSYPAETVPVSILSIRIHPPWYQTIVAYVGYGLLFILIGTLIIYYFLKSKLATLRAEKTKEVNELQSRMFANISHEFRTPVTIIKGFANTILKQEKKEELEEKVMGITKSSDQILNLVNQMLDLAALDEKKVALNYINTNIIAFIEKCVKLYTPLATSKGIAMNFQAEFPEVCMDFDDDKIQKIINNLLSNAIKFTPEKGTIKIEVKVRENQLVLIVSDTGIGIKKGQLPFVFDRYYRANQFTETMGSGIGMALTKELVVLLEGIIEVQSELGQGTTFVIYLPIRNAYPSAKEAVHTMPFISRQMKAKEEEPSNTIRSEVCILVVEDSDEIRSYMKELLGAKYTILTANNGKEGLIIAQKRAIDFIISDIMMPVMDGFEFCKQLKSDVGTSHIPFVILSARTEASDKVKAYQYGIDAYLPKPFDEEELMAIIANLIKKQEERNRYFGKLLQLKETAIEEKDIKKQELDFIKKVQEYALQKDQKLSIDQLAKELYTSRTQLHRKVKGLTGKSTTHYINHIRIEKAKELLLTTSLHIAEISFEVGFDTPAYFSKIFKKIEGRSPSEYRKTKE
ncbi:ATP-binding protein [Aquimarina hainanensis]|uniref:histidine kinase n=1 Tax=Aquimarina hainanensis TaxID=1578017 RepID=A0ABW5NDZ2_9FLAO